MACWINSRLSAGTGESPVFVFGLNGLIGKSNVRAAPVTRPLTASTPFVVSRSSPASTLLPSVSFPPSVIQPRLLKVYGASFPMRVIEVRAIPAP
ncbi:MAG: hypothetical protein IPK98_11265 [Chloracidobacterium sp.]|nr:hypothetical protein [Chloracidobacterium sp.]